VNPETIISGWTVILCYECCSFLIDGFLFRALYNFLRLCLGVLPLVKGMGFGFLCYVEKDLIIDDFEV